MAKIIGCKFDRDEVIVYGRSKKPIDPHKAKLLEEERKRIKKDDVIIVDTGFTNNAKFYVDASCFEDNKISPNVKWTMAYQHAFYDASTKGGNIPPELWALNEGDKSIKYLGMDKHYKKGEFLTVKLLGNSESMYYYGYIQKVIVFTDKPEDGFTFYIIPVSYPHISFAHFENSEKNWQYGEAVNLLVHYHNLCSTDNNILYSQVFVIENNNSNKAITAEEGNEIDFENIKHVSVWSSEESPMPEIDKREKGVNSLGKYSILIDYENWRKGEVKEKQFSVISVVYAKKYDYWGNVTYKVKRFRNFLAQPTNNLYQYDSKTLSIKDIDIKESSISSRIVVQKDFISEILAKREIEKHNMIQYIGDIEYNRKENNPCAFSVITVNDGKNDIEIFNEYKLNKKVDDETSRFVDIVVGDKDKKKVKVTAKFKKNKDAKPEAVRTLQNGHSCQKILNDGEFHNGINDVFKMGWIVGQWVPSKDPALFAERYMKMLGLGNKPKFYNPSNGSSSPKLEWNKPDQDAKGMKTSEDEQKKYEAVTVAGIQGLTDKDYTIDEGNDSITLELQYIYNKMYNSRISYYLYEEQKYLKEGILSDNFKNLWVVDYLLKWIKNEPLEQIYFVPVTTCRYPNQIAQIRVFPDMKWVLNFNYNIETPLYYKSSTALETYYSGYNEGSDIVTSNSSRRAAIQESNTTNILQPYAGTKSSFGLSIECEVSGEDDVINLGKDFAEKYRKMLSPFLSMINTLDSSFGVSKAETERNDQRNSSDTSKGLFDRLNSYPWSFELKPPSLGVGLGIGYATSKNGIITYELDGRLKADPIIGADVTLDILALGSKFKPWGAIIDALDIASWLANAFSGGRLELEYKIEVRFSAEVKLVGKKIKDAEGDEPAVYESEANMKYNFADKTLDFNGGLEGKILGEIEISLSVRFMSKNKVEAKPENDKHNIAEIGAGVQASSYVELKCPFKLNKDGNLDMDFFFSGIELKVWFKASINDKNNDEEADISKKIIPHFNEIKTFKF
ncbi:hypothetical protein GCM10023210_26950 [Chryseobacterium ginsengisoli]|uniref:Uncharacterized protein n=1 Tax=Chryseobacterium ginsengisoli TaxID=363853 RepID=A0ABP9MIZ5_9FLAO